MSNTDASTVFDEPRNGIFRKADHIDGRRSFHATPVTSNPDYHWLDRLPPDRQGKVGLRKTFQ